jgi:hypothetical protein
VKWLGLALLVVLLSFADILGGRAFVGFDHALEYFPTWVFQRRSLLQGELPLWDPRAGAGVPLLAATFGGALDPVRWIFLPLPEVAGYGLHMVALHLIAAAGAFGLARSLGARPSVAACAAVMLGVGGPLRSLGGFEKELASAAWVPWVLVLAVELARRPSLRGALLAGAVLAVMVLAGGPEYALAGSVIVVAASVLPAPAKRAEGRGGRRLLGVLAPLVALLLSTGVLFPARELMELSTRRFGVDAEQLSAHATHPLELLTLLLPGLFGSSALEPRPLGAALFDQSYFMPLLYPGLLVLFIPLAPWRRRSVRALGLVLAFSLWFAFGEKAGLFKLVMDLAPPLRVFRYAYKAWSFVAPALAVLAALGLERALAQGVPSWARRFFLGVVLAGAVLALVGGAATLLPELRERSRLTLLPDEPAPLVAITEPELRDAAHVLLVRGAFLAAFCGVLAFAGPRQIALLALVSLVELAATGHAATPTVPSSFYETPPAFAAFFTGTPPTRFYPASREAPLRREFEHAWGDAYWEYDKVSLRPNLATVWGLEQLHSYLPGKLAWQNKLEWELEVERTPAERTRLLAALGVELVESRGRVVNPGLAFVASETRFGQHLYRIRGVRPRYEVCDEVKLVETHEAALHELGRTDAVLLRRDGETTEDEDWRLLEAPGRLPSLSTNDPSLGDAAPVATAARVLVLEPRRVELELPRPAREGQVLLARDAFYPRWRAFVDDVPAPVLRADFAFRAVRLPAGARRVVLEFDAALEHRTFALQALAWAAVAIAVAIARPRLA